MKLSGGADGADFLAAFTELKAAVGDDPDMLQKEWEGSERLQELCDRLHRSNRMFEVVEEWSPFAFTPHVPAAAAAARKDYEERWTQAVNWVANRDLHSLLESLLGDIESDVGSDQSDGDRDQLGENIADWKETGREEAARIQSMVDHAFDERQDDPFGNFDWVDGSLEAWDRLLKVCGLDLRGALWRRRAVPHILIPSHVSRHYGKERASLYRRLDQALKAFVFGAPLAAVTLQRAILEEVLRDHWGAEKGHIRDAKLPEHSWDIRAEKLKRLGNEILHSDPEKLSRSELERAIIENFGLLKLVIEAAPQQAGKPL